MPPKPLINCSGCLTWHPGPSCLWKSSTQKVTAQLNPNPGLNMAEGFSQEELVSIFGDGGGKGLVPEHDSASIWITSRRHWYRSKRRWKTLAKLVILQMLRQGVHNCLSHSHLWWTQHPVPSHHRRSEGFQL